MEAGSRMEHGTMARRRGKTERGNGLGAAVERYRAAFGADALPCLTTVTEEAVPVAVALLDHAAALGEEAALMSGCL